MRKIRMLTVVFTVAVEDSKFLSSKQYEYRSFPQVISREVPLSKARKECIDQVCTEYCLILDLDTVLPKDYIEEALGILMKYSKVAAVALDYQVPYSQGHLAFGTSMWRTLMLKELYNWTEDKLPLCECNYIWGKVHADKRGLKVAALPMLAIHNR